MLGGLKGDVALSFKTLHNVINLKRPNVQLRTNFHGETMKNTLQKLKLITLIYLTACMITGTAVAADGIAYTTALATSVSLNIIGGAANSFCSSAYADNERSGSKAPTLVSSKPAIWVNYSDPRPKGDDADNGAAPSYVPQVSINNVSLMPAVSIRLFSVNASVGPADISPMLIYSPPTISKSVDIMNLSAITYTAAADAGTFGNCWSDNLTPCVERSANRKTVIFSNYYEHTISIKNGPTPSASFKGPNNTSVDFDCDWEAQPLTKASVNNDYIKYWGSGIIIDEDNEVTRDAYFIEKSLTLISSNIWTWPKYIYDRNANKLKFSFSECFFAPASFSQSASFSVDATKLRVATNICNLATGDELCLNMSNYVQTIANGCPATTTPTITNITHLRNGEFLRSVDLSYTSWSYFSGDDVSYNLQLLSSIRLPNGDIVSFDYTSATFESCPTELSNLNLPLLTEIISPAGTTIINYSNLSLTQYDDCYTWKYEPSEVSVYSDSRLTTNIYKRTGNAFNSVTGSGWVEMETHSSAGTTNKKRYTLFYEPLNMQWYGCETENTLDDVKQYSYKLNTDRFLYTNVTRYPLGVNGPTDSSSFAYDSQDNLTKAIDAYGNQTRFFYAPNKLDQTCVIDPREIMASNVFDNCGNLLKTIEDVGNGRINRTSSNLYNEAGQVIKSFDPLNRITRNYYKTNGTPESVSSYTGEPDTNNFGYLVATRDPLDRVTTFTYDKFGRKTIVNAPGNSTSARYATTNYYDIMDRATATYYPDGTYVSNYYNAKGYPTSVCDRMGRWTQNTYDDAGHLTRVDYPNGDWVEKLYKGNLVSMLIDGAGNTTEYFYCHEQLTGVKFPDGSTRAAGFDNLNRQIWAVDERGVAVTNAYDKLDRVIASVYIPFDDIDDMPPDVTTIPSGLSPTICDESQIYGGFDNQNITYAYDKVGNVTNMSDWACTITNAYDALNRKITEYTKNNYNQNIEYAFYNEYDLLNNRTKLRLIAPDDGLTNTYTYDNLNRLSSLECNNTISTTFAYNPNGKISGITNSQIGINRDFIYDTEQRLSAINADYYGSSRLNLSYEYNNAQQITDIDETLDGSLKSYGFTYDNRDQLESETYENTQTDYDYDNAQNRTSRSQTPDIDTYSYVHANKLTNILFGSSSANNQYFYDIAGNLTSNVTNDKINYYYYNAQNKLSRILRYLNGFGLIGAYEFKYDSQNRRIGLYYLTQRWTIHDGNIPIAELKYDLLNAQYEFGKVFVRGIGIAEGTGDVLAEIDSSGDAHYYLPNHRGDTLMALDENGDIERKIRYDAFGNVKENTGTFTPTYTFSTKEYLSDAQLYLYAYRVYDPIAGRWTQRDPIDYQDSINLYQFCGNNPVNKTDADGQCATVAGAGIGGAIGFAAGFLFSEEKGFKNRFKSGLKTGIKGLIVGALAGSVVDTFGASAGVIVAAGAVASGSVELGTQLGNGNLDTANGWASVGIATITGMSGGLGRGALPALSVGAAAGVSQTAADIYTKTAVETQKTGEHIFNKNNEAKREALKAAEEQYR